MPIEIEKKYRLTAAQRRAVEKSMRGMGLKARSVELEENTIFRGRDLKLGSRALRLRRVNNRGILTFKRRIPSGSPIKHQEEDETGVLDPDALEAILVGLGFERALVYEKRRTSWLVGKARVVIDELPFGLFMEIEAPEKEIKRVEKLIAAQDFPAVEETYPSLTAKFGRKRKGIIEARFRKRV